MQDVEETEGNIHFNLIHAIFLLLLFEIRVFN